MVIDPLILARGIHFVATALASGTVGFMVLVAEPAASAIGAPAGWSALRRRLTLMVWAALAVALLSGIGWWLLLAAEIYGAPIVEVFRDGGAWQVATNTRFGLVWGVRAGLAMLLGSLMLRPAARLLRLAAAAGLIALLACIGHAGATVGPSGRIHLAFDMVHLLAAGAWLGALPALLLLLMRARGSGEPAWGAMATAAAKRFSPIGIACVGALLASGAGNSWKLLAGPRDLIATGYGLLVLVKIVLFLVMVAIAAVNRYRIVPKLPALAGMRALQRNILCEIGLGLCVILFVAVLGTMTPTAHVHSSSSEIPPDAAFVHIHGLEAMADVTIDPGRSGIVTARIRVSREDFAQFPATEVRLALDPPAAKLNTVARATVRMPDGTWQAENILIPQRGIWILRVTVVPETGDPIVLDAPIVIE